MNKFDRVVSILMLLQTKPIVRAQDLADKFEVSLRTIYRDLRTLENAGVPLHAEAGIGYSLVDGYNLPPVMFTESEATTFLVAEKLMEKMTDGNTSKLFGDAVSKIKSVLKSQEKEKINNLEEHIYVSSRAVEVPVPKEERMPMIFNSIDQKHTLEIAYEAIYNKQKTVRKIEPLGVHFYSSYWHLIAYCRMREDYRDFRIDRIQRIEETQEEFKTDHPSLHEYLGDMAIRQDLTEVEIFFSEKVVPYARTEKFFHGFIGEREVEGGTYMKFLSPSLIGMAHWLLIFTNGIEIIEPAALKENMVRLTKELVEIYNCRE